MLARACVYMMQNIEASSRSIIPKMLSNMVLATLSLNHYGLQQVYVGVQDMKIKREERQRESERKRDCICGEIDSAGI